MAHPARPLHFTPWGHVGGGGRRAALFRRDGNVHCRGYTHWGGCALPLRSAVASSRFVATALWGRGSARRCLRSAGRQWAVMRLRGDVVVSDYGCSLQRRGAARQWLLLGECGQRLDLAMAPSLLSRGSPPQWRGRAAAQGGRGPWLGSTLVPAFSRRDRPLCRHNSARRRACAPRFPFAVARLCSAATTICRGAIACE